MPGLGDFFRIALPTAFTRPWDSWLQRSLGDARAALGARWQDAYMSAPIWRFSLAGGLAGHAVSGVLMPSVDRVGRMFPLTVAGQGAPLTARTFAALEDIALATLEGDVTRDALAEALAQVPQDREAAEVAGSRWEAVLEGGPLRMTSVGLPGGAQARALFDLSAWPGMSEPLRQASS